MAILSLSTSSRLLDANHGQRARRISRRLAHKSAQAANGRRITRGSGEIDWYSFDLPSKINDLSDSSETLVLVRPDRSRIEQYQGASGATITYAGTLFEFEDRDSMQQIGEPVLLRKVR